MIPLYTLGQRLRAVDHELVVLEAELLERSRLLQKTFEGLTDVRSQVIFGQVKSLQVARAVNNGDSTLALQIILANLENAEIFVLGEGHADALSAIRAKVIVINRQRLDRLVADE